MVKTTPLPTEENELHLLKYRYFSEQACLFFVIKRLYHFFYLKAGCMIQKMKDTFSWEDSYLENSSLPVFLIYSSLLPHPPMER